MIYLDNAATTKLSPQVLETMLPYMTEQYGNPSTLYSLGMKAKKAVNQARREMAGRLGVKMEELYFTSGGSESDNWAIKGVAYANQSKGKHIITSRVEHHAVLHTCKALEKQGFEVTYLPVDAKGFVSPADLERSIRPDTILISIMYANNELGTIEPIEEIGSIARKHGVLFHTDAVQAFGQVEMNLGMLPVDLLSASAHKFHGPKGVGLLYVKSGVKLENLVEGGGQESTHRAGTENVPGIVGLAKAFELAVENLTANNQKKQELKKYLVEQLQQTIPNCHINHPGENCLPGTVHVSFPYVEGESMLVQLDMKGICASSGSACTTGEKDPSHVLMATGMSELDAKGSLRLTLSEENTKEEMDQVVKALADIVSKLRAMVGR